MIVVVLLSLLLLLAVECAKGSNRRVRRPHKKDSVPLRGEATVPEGPPKRAYSGMWCDHTVILPVECERHRLKRRGLYTSVWDNIVVVPPDYANHSTVVVVVRSNCYKCL